MSATPADATYVIVISGLLGIAFAIFQYFKVNGVGPDSPGFAAEYRELSGEARSRALVELYNQIGEGPVHSLQIRICAVFLIVFAVVIFILTARGHLSAVLFLVGGLTSVVSGISV